MELGEIWGYVTDRLYTVDDFDADGKLKPGIAKVEGYNPNPGDILYICPCLSLLQGKAS